MAGAALSRKVIGRLVVGMARRAIRLPSVVEAGGLPRRGGVTVAALSRKVIGRLVVGMARRAIRLAGMIEVGRLPRR